MAWFPSRTSRPKSVPQAKAATRRQRQRQLTLESLEKREVFAFALELMSAPGVIAIGNANSVNADVSDNARFVVFQSDASNLVIGDTNGVTDIFLKDRATGFLYLVSTSTDNVLGNNDSTNPVISGDGRYVAWESNATNLV